MLKTNTLCLSLCQPYWRLGKTLMEKKKYMESCDYFLRGMACDEADADQKALFVQEVCSMLASLTSEYVAMISAVVMVV